MYTEKCKKAIAALESITGAFAKTEQLAIATLKALLLPVGEHGVTVTNLDELAEDEFIVLAEEKPFDFKPVTLVRYNEKKDSIEVFVSEWEEYKVSVSAEGRWVDIEDAHVDMHFLLDNVITNLEWADYYNEEE